MLRVRDEIVLTQAQVNAAGTDTAYFVARRILLAEDIRVIPDELVLVADELIGQGHVIDAAGRAPTPNGGTGTGGVGHSPYGVIGGLPDEKLFGGDGGPGGDGDPGESGHNVQIWAKFVTELPSVSTAGADGGRGGDGGGGGNGTWNLLRLRHGWAGSGGRGGVGGPGGWGGRVVFVSGPDSGETAIYPFGGRGGEGGQGGRPGDPTVPPKVPWRDRTKERLYYDMVGGPGQVIPPSYGLHGKSGHGGIQRGHVLVGISKATDLSDQLQWFHSTVLRDLPDIATAWGIFRAQRAEWLFRTASDDSRRYDQALVEAKASLELLPDPPSYMGLLGFLGDSFKEFIEAEATDIVTPFPFPFPVPFPIPIENYQKPDIALMRPTESPHPIRRRVERVARLIRMNCTPFGLPWDHDPDYGYEHYKAPTLEFLNMFGNAIIRAESRLHPALTISSITDVLHLIDAAAKGALLVVAEDEKMVASKQKTIEDELKRLQDRWEENQQEQRARRVEMESEAVLGDLLGFAQTALALASLLAAGFGAVAALPAVYGAMVKASALLASSGGGIVDDFVDFSKPALRPEAKKVFEEGTAFFKAASVVFDAAKTVQKVSQATADEKLNKLLAEQATILVERGKLAVAGGQISLEMSVVRARKAASQDLADEAVSAIANSTDVELALTQLSLLLVSQIRLYVDTIHRYHFEAARALQRWLFDETRLSLFCGYAWVDPEIELALTEPPAPNMAPDEQREARRQALVHFLAAIQNSTTRFDFANLSPKFDDSLKKINYSSVELTLTGSQVRKLAEVGIVSFLLDESQVPETVSRQTHVEAVEMSYSAGSGYDVEVSLDPMWHVHLLDGELRTGVDHRRSMNVTPVSTPELLEEIVAHKLSNLRGHGPSAENQFWACSPFRQWTLRNASRPETVLPPDQQIVMKIVLSGHAPSS